MHQKKALKIVWFVHQEHIQTKLGKDNALLVILGNIQVMAHHFAKNVYQEHDQINYMVHLLV
jgi:hypothetical protein